MQAIAGLAVLAGAILAFQQLTDDRQQAAATRELTLQGQASERFTRAIDQLGSTRPDAQLGGIYALEQIAKQAPDNRLAVTEVLVAYLHRRTPRPATPPSVRRVEELRRRAPDAQAALTVLGRRQIAATDPRLDLKSLHLSGADLRSAKLHHALLTDADLRGAVFTSADLRGAFLTNANLTGADLRSAHLIGASLGQANLSSANLSSANLTGTNLMADLRAADLGFANLTGAHLRGANLRGARLGAANLTDADLRNAHLNKAFVIGADLRGADLRGADLTAATADQWTRWPDGFDWRRAGVHTMTSP